MVIVGKRAAEGIVEFKDRATLEKKEVTIEEAVKLINEAVKSI
jgi:prolyl-tRNA synthetase